VRVHLAGVARYQGAATILHDVTLTVGPHSRLGLVGPNGVGKTTLLRLVAGLETADAGTVTREPEALSVGYVPQELQWRRNETVLAALRRGTGVSAAEEELERAGTTVASGDAGAGDRFDAALARFVALGCGDLEARARSVCAELGLATPLDQMAKTLSGGEAARVSLAVILLSRHDVLCLDEPTNDLDFEGLAVLERFVDGYAGALVVVSHDRAFLDRTVSRVVEIDPWRHGIREFAGGWSDYARRRDEERTAAYARFDEADARRRELSELLARRRAEARAGGAQADRRGTRALRTKVRQTERLLERNEFPGKPFEPWELQLSLDSGERPGSLVAALHGAVADLGTFRLGPVDLDLTPGERLAVTGPNGSGKSTLLGMLLGDVALAAGERAVGRRTTIGSIGQGRDPFARDDELLDAFVRRCALGREDARTLLAKFGLGAQHVERPCSSLSPGERTRAHLAELQARGVNVLVLDEPTNHLDLEAVEQLEAALAGYGGTVVVVSHDRRFLESVRPTRELALPFSR